MSTHLVKGRILYKSVKSSRSRCDTLNVGTQPQRLEILISRCPRRSRVEQRAVRWELEHEVSNAEDSVEGREIRSAERPSLAFWFYLKSKTWLIWKSFWNSGLGGASEFGIELKKEKIIALIVDRGQTMRTRILRPMSACKSYILSLTYCLHGAQELFYVFQGV